jgi:hypothetical protein
LLVPPNDAHSFYSDGRRYDGFRALRYASSVVFGCFTSVLGWHFDAANDILRILYFDFIDFD